MQGAEDKKSWLVFVPMPLLLVALFVAFGGVSRENLPKPATARDPTTLAVDFDAKYLDRSRIAHQSVATPDLVRTILLPTIAVPARADTSTISVILARPPRPLERFVLIPRDALDAIDELAYSIPPRARSTDLLRERLADTRERRANHGQTTPGLSDAQRQALLASFADEARTQKLDALYARLATASASELRATIQKIRDAVETAARTPDAIPLAAKNSTPLGNATKLELAPASSTLAPGLYTLAILDERAGLADMQLNAVYKPQSSSTFRFVVAADWQWGRNRHVAESIIEWVALMNGIYASKDETLRPEFALLVGDMVDGQFGSANTVTGQLFGSGADYPLDFLQAWLALAAARIPIYVQPGNHDGYRFQGLFGETISDGLLLYENTFGPLYFSFERAPFRFILLNTYDLPPEYRTSRRSGSSGLFEHVSDKLNVLNWGGGIGHAQLAWFRDALDTTRSPLVFGHHDPRGTHPFIKRTIDGRHGIWSTARHFPITGARTERGTLFASRAPHFEDTEEAHPGYYTPLRKPSTTIRSKEWFELGLNPVPPATNGFPGWLRWGEVWHSNFVYAGKITDQTPFEVEPDVVAPGLVLSAIRDAGVPYLFCAHDNRFARADLSANESIFGDAAAQELARYGDAETRAILRGTVLARPLTVYHVADVADFDSDGHGFFWIEAANDGTLQAYEIDHF